MKVSFSYNRTLGLARDQEDIYGVAMRFVKGKPVIENLLSWNLSNSTTVELQDAVSQLSTFEKSHLFITGINAKEVLIRSLKMQLTRESAINAAIPFQAEPLLPYALDEAIIEKSILFQNREATHLSLFACRKDHLAKHLEEWKNIGAVPEIVSCTPLALTSLCRYLYGDKCTLLVVHLSSSHLVCASIQEGKLYSSQTLFKGSKTLFEAFINDCGSRNKAIEMWPHLDFLKLSNTDTPNLFRAFNSFKKEFSHLLFALNSQSKKDYPDKIFFTGNTSQLTHIENALMQDSSYSLQTIPEQHFPNYSSSQIKEYSIAIGLALNESSEQKNSVNFRKDVYAYPYPWKRYKPILLLTATLSILLAVSFFLFGHAYLTHKNDTLKKSYLELLTLSHKPFEEVEALLPKQEAIPSPDFLDSESLKERLLAIETSLTKNRDPFPLYPNVPRVSDLIAWLSSLPQTTATDQNSQGKSIPRLQLETLHYKMIKRPEKKKPKEKYSVKVDLAFTSSHPRYARDFHDVLMSINPMIDARKEIKWNQDRGKYRVSFYLKDKTQYR